MNLLAELRRRSVFRVAAAYLISGWVVMQVVALIAEASGLPTWTSSFALVLLIVGLPIALIVAWAFEITPEGVKQTDKSGESIPIRPFSVADGVLLAGLAVVIGFIGWQQFAAPERIAVAGPTASNELNEVATTGPEAASIAVLAFADLSEEGDQEYFSDGISEELLNVLVRVEGLRVASRTSAFRFKNTNASIPEIGLDLNVRHVLEGSVRRSGDTIRITAQLIDSATDEHLWSETYDREMTTSNLFEVQDDIATAIVAALSERLQGILPATEIEVEAVTSNLTAYELFLQGRALFARRVDMALVDRLMARATELDPSFAEAWEVRAAARYLGPDYGGFEEEQDVLYAQALEFAQRAMALDPESSLAIAVTTNVRNRLADPIDAETVHATVEGYTRALEIDPRNTSALNWRGLMLAYVGEIQLALDDFEQCVEIEPYYMPCRGNLSVFSSFLGDGQRAYDEFIELRNQGGNLPIYPFWALAEQGKQDLFIVLASELYGSNAPWGDHEELYEILRTLDQDHSHLLEAVTAFETERDTYDFPFGGIDVLLGNYEREGVQNVLPWAPELTMFRRSDAFQELLADSPLPEYWRTYGFPPLCREREDGRIECD